jgi:hypothetical protein
VQHNGISLEEIAWFLVKCLYNQHIIMTVDLFDVQTKDKDGLT